MPIYEFQCNACGARLSRLVRVMGADAAGTCDRCGSPDLRRLVSRVAILRAPLDPGSLSKQELLDGVNYTDPASMASFFRRMQDTFHDEPNEHMDEIVGRLDHGEAVEKALDLHMHSHGDGHSHGGDGSDAGGDAGE
jgi:putative FmdB family regulatory protein